MKYFFTLFALMSTLNAFGACDPCVCGLGGHNPWPDHLREFCNQDDQNRPGPAKSCISLNSAKDILEVNINEINSTTFGQQVQLISALRKLSFSAHSQQYTSEFSLNGKNERLSVTCYGEFDTRFVNF